MWEKDTLVPSASSPRLQGDDYQHLYAWYRVLALRKPGTRVDQVSVEMPGVGALDDVVTHLRLEGGPHSEYCQIKFHVDQRAQYSTDLLLAEDGGKRSLLKKLFSGWQAVSQLCERHIAVFLSNWAWDPKDPVARLIDGRTCRISQEFLTATERSNVGKCRQRWIEHLQADPDEFSQFVASLHIVTGYSCEKKLWEDIEERMASIGLRSDETAILTGLYQIREWVKAGTVTIDDVLLGEAIVHHKLEAERPEKSAVVHLHTIVHRAFSDEADYVIDWVDLFEEQAGGQHGHLPLQADAWQTIMWPDLLQLRSTLDLVPDLRLLRMRGQARLSAWLAAGYVFRQTAGYELEVTQGSLLCRTDAAPSADFQLLKPAEMVELGDGPDVAIGVSVSGDLSEDVLSHLRHHAPSYGSALLLRPDRPLGRDVIRRAEDVVALASGVKQAAQRFVRQREAKRLGLFYLGPFSGALFIGHNLNAVAAEIQVFEDADPGYVPAFLLR